MGDPYIGEIRIFPYNFCPENWLECDGREYPIAQYQALAAVVGTIYGTAGSGMFKVPNLLGYAPVGTGHGPSLSNYQLGGTQGNASVTLNLSQLPSHSHNMIARVGNVTTGGLSIYTSAPADARLAPLYTHPNSTAKWVAVNDVSPTATAGSVLGAQSLTPSGASASHENRQPFLAFRFCIAWMGVFPVHS